MTLFRTLALACSLMLLAAVLVLPAHTQGHGSIPMTEQVRFPEGRDSVSIPFENWGEHLIIPVSVNGQPPLQMVFDTGMPIPGVLLYESALVDSMKLAFGPMQVNVGGAGGGGSMKARLAPGVTLGLGALSVSGSVAIVMPQTPLSSLHDGIIGASLFNGLVVAVDHDRNVMTLTNRGRSRHPRVPPRCRSRWWGGTPTSRRASWAPTASSRACGSSSTSGPRTPCRSISVRIPPSDCRRARSPRASAAA
jgi:hypothetical protein